MTRPEAVFKNAIDKMSQLDEPDTVTREHWRRVRGLCEECGGPLTDRQRASGTRFCRPRCSGRNVARREYGPDAIPPATPAQEKEGPVGIVHDLISDEYDVTTGEKNGYRPPPELPDRCEQCTQPYRKSRKDQRFCCPDCRRRWGAAHPKPAPSKEITVAPVAPAAGNGAAPLPVSVAALIGKALETADTWTFDAHFGDIHLVLSREDR